MARRSAKKLMGYTLALAALTAELLPIVHYGFAPRYAVAQETAPNPAPEAGNEEEGENSISTDQAINLLLSVYGMKGYNEKTTKPVIENRWGSAIPQKMGEVRQKMDEWLIDDPANTSKKLVREELWDNFQGADFAVMARKYMEDAVDLIANFSIVNILPLHTFPQMLIPPMPMPWLCGLHWQYLGFEAGTCYWMFPSPNPLCGFVWWETSSLVEYHYPAYKIDVSEQMWQTFYFPYEIQKVIIQILNELLAKWAPYAAVQTMYLTYQRVRSEARAYGIDLPPPPRIRPDVETIENLVKLMKKSNREEALGSAANAMKEFGRTFFEPLNLLSLVFTHIPHVAKFHLWTSDLPVGMWGMIGGYFYSKIIGLSLATPTTKEWAMQIAIYLINVGMSYVPGAQKAGAIVSGIRRCIANNKAVPRGSPKSPIDVDNPVGSLQDILNSPPIQSLEKSLGVDLCMDLIGEVFPFVDVRRLHITDATFQAAWKGLKLFTNLLPLEQLIMDPVQTIKEAMQQLAQQAIQQGIQIGFSYIPGNVNQIIGQVEQGINLIGNLVQNFQQQGWQQASINALTNVGQQFALNFLAWVAPRHSFRRELDKWFVIGNKFLRSDQERAGKQALTIDFMTMINVALDTAGLKYDVANIKVAKSGNEMPFELWPLFKGCWHPGAKGIPPMFFIEAPRPPLPIPPIPWWLWFPTKIPLTLRLF